MKILLTVHQFLPSFAAGTEILTFSVARELMRRGHTVHVLTGHPAGVELNDEERFDEYDFQGIHVYRFHHAYTPMASQSSLIEVGYDNHVAAAYFERILDRFQPDLVHFFHLNRLGTGLIERLVRAGIPGFITPTDFWAVCQTGQLVCADGSMCSGPSSNGGNCLKHIAQKTQGGLVGTVAHGLPTPVADALVRLTQKGVLSSYPRRNEVLAVGARLGVNIARMNQLNAIVAPNRFMQEVLARNGVRPDLITCAEYGIDVVSENPSVERSESRPPLRIGFIGTLAQHKGCHILVKAFQELPHGQAVLKIYGNPDELPDYANEIRLLAGSNEAIELCGTFPNEKIGEIFAGLDVLVVPSLWYENTPLVVYSAQAARCPVVASDFPGISAVIKDQDNGLLFEAGNAQALARSLIRLVDEPGLLLALSSKSRQPRSTTLYVDDLVRIWGSVKA